MKTSLLLCSFAILFCIGCGGTPVPDELKDMAPVTITVTDGSQAIEGVAVSLSSKTSGGAWASRGVTNASGVAEIQTMRASYTGKGAPSGDYKVTLLKMPDLPPDLKQIAEKSSISPQDEAKLNEFYEKNRIIPKVFELPNTSPVELTVVSKTGAVLTIDLSQYKK